MSGKYRVWVAHERTLKMRISIKPPKNAAEIRKLFGIPAHVKLTPRLDKRMRNGGRA